MTGGSEPEALRAQSRAEPPAGSRLALAIGAITLILVGTAIGFKLTHARPANVPMGIAGFRFGSSVEAAKKTLPSLGPAPPLPAVVTQVTGVEAEYPRLAGKTLVFDEPATCTLEFAVGDTLSRIDCDVDPLPSGELHDKTTARLLATLRQLYGAESSSRPGYWEWRNTTGRLSLYASGAKDPAYVIRVTNTERQHDIFVSRLLQAERERQLTDAKQILEERKKEVERLQREIEAGVSARDE